jgi:hypothetical protein
MWDVWEGLFAVSPKGDGDRGCFELGGRCSWVVRSEILRVAQNDKAMRGRVKYHTEKMKNW